MFAPFHYAFVQRGMLEALLLSIPAGILGTWIVLRGLAFFSHAVGTAAFPGLVLAAGLGWPGPAGAAVAVTAYTLGVESLASRRESNRETTTGLVLVGALAHGSRSSPFSSWPVAARARGEAAFGSSRRRRRSRIGFGPWAVTTSTSTRSSSRTPTPTSTSRDRRTSRRRPVRRSSSRTVTGSTSSEP